MPASKNSVHKIILWAVGIIVLILGIVSFIIPSALFTDPSQGFQVLRCMQLGGGFNNLVSADQSDISQNYSQFLTWWSPGQYLAPYFFKLITGLNLGQGIALATTVAEFCGLAGFYCFFKKIGFSPVVAAVSLVFIIGQEAFMIPHVYYNGGEILLFSFEGWFLYGCMSINSAGFKMMLFVLFSCFTGFFLKSSFLWMFGAGVCCLWIRLSTQKGPAAWIKNALWMGIPAALSVVVIYIFYISKGESPVTNGTGLKLTVETFGFPVASPALAGFSVDDMVNGLIEHFGKPMFNTEWSIIILIVLALLSVLLILAIMRYVPVKDYKLFVIVFYCMAILFFGFSYLRQLDISMESRHFRIIGLLIVPGIIYLVERSGRAYKLLFSLLFLVIACHSVWYVINGYKTNNRQAKGPTGIAQPNIDQTSLNQVMTLDREKRNVTFVFIGDDIGLEILHNRFIPLQPINDDLKMDIDDYRYEGFAGQLYIIMPETYNGPKEKMILKAFPGYTGFNVTMLSDSFVLYASNRKR